MSKISIKTLGPDDAPALAPLIAEYAQALKRGAPVVLTSITPNESWGTARPR